MAEIELHRAPEALYMQQAPIIFWVGDKTEILRFELNGDCYVRGEKVDSNPEVYRAMREWMAKCGVLPENDVAAAIPLAPTE